FKGDWTVRSNEETGDGYGDIIIEIEDEDIGIIIEMKYAERSQFAAVCREAINQINAKNYTEKLLYDGYRTIYKYGIACRRKMCRVLCETEVAE
ncbi:MAG: PD-(D/E)XK nuclease domain-containing protein, partial [Firmicutes bacterium]|nr:PD-(D/E)XK nuclease domain-containing protein [Bacillota bacterium]